MLASNRVEVWREMVEQRLASHRFHTDIRLRLWAARRPKRNWFSRQVRRQMGRLGRTLIALGRWLQKVELRQQPFVRS